MVKLELLMAHEITIVIVFSTILILVLVKSAPLDLKYSAITNKPEENKDNSLTGLQLQCYTGTYTSELILKNGLLQQLSNYSQVCPEGSSSCFIRRIGENFTFGCAKKNPEIGAGECRTQVTNNNSIEISECHCHTNKCLVLSIFGGTNYFDELKEIFGKHNSFSSKRCRKLACGLLEIDGIIGVIFLATFLLLGLLLTPIMYSRK